MSEQGQTDTERPDSLCREDDGCPTEGAVLKRDWRRMTAELTSLRASQAALVEALKGMLEPYGNTPAKPPYFTPEAASKISAARAALVQSQERT